MKLTAATIVTIGALLLPTIAQAHISLHPNTIPAGAFATLDVRVPGEQEGAHVKKIDMLFPSGFTSVNYENVPGWTVKVINQKLATPIQTDSGPINEQVSQIIWAWTGPLGQVNNNQFINLPLSLAIPGNTAGGALQFKTIQTYSNGQVVHWIDPTLDAEHPAPTINVTAKGGVIQDIAGKEAGPEPGQLPATPVQSSAVKTSGGASKGLGIAALILGALGLAAGLAALAASRRTRTSA
ncbi:MAG TPA: YcnI family protein [Solirubrobacteraceae bacterium]|nr:YcnI family protein [Solirubrobacteraceae bacterium]